jgi:hypothetical protein
LVELAIDWPKASLNQPESSSARRCSAFDQTSAWLAKLNFWQFGLHNFNDHGLDTQLLHGNNELVSVNRLGHVRRRPGDQPNGYSGDSGRNKCWDRNRSLPAHGD